MLLCFTILFFNLSYFTWIYLTFLYFILVYVTLLYFPSLYLVLSCFHQTTTEIMILHVRHFQFATSGYFWSTLHTFAWISFELHLVHKIAIELHLFQKCRHPNRGRTGEAPREPGRNRGSAPGTGEEPGKRGGNRGGTGEAPREPGRNRGSALGTGGEMGKRLFPCNDYKIQK